MVQTKTSRKMPYETQQPTYQTGPGENQDVTEMTTCNRRASIQPSPAHGHRYYVSNSYNHVNYCESFAYLSDSSATEDNQHCRPSENQIGGDVHD